MKVCIVTGEASGDLHAAHLLQALRSRIPETVAFGTGGDALAGQGMELLRHVRDLGIVGLVNVLRHLPMFFRLRDELVETIVRRRPDVVVLVDYPDFNLRLAKKIRRLGIPIVYYISPQVWAWRRGRVRQISRLVDHMIVIFPFEESFYRNHGVPVSYVGHPLIDQMSALAGNIERAEEVRSTANIALLPGSRRAEVADLLPPMLEAVRAIKSRRPVNAYVVRASTIRREQIEELALAAGVEVQALDSGRQALAMADLALASSGTATLECAILEVPVVVMYRLSPMTYRLARLLVKIPHFSLVNIVAGRALVPELLQDAVTPDRIAREAERLLSSPDRGATLEGLREVRQALGEPGAAGRAADVVIETVRRSSLESART